MVGHWRGIALFVVLLTKKDSILLPFVVYLKRTYTLLPVITLTSFTLTYLRCPMEKAEFSKIRKKLGKTQKQLAALLGMSLKTIHSYEQGWRSIPAHIERQLFFLLINQRQRDNQLEPCWEQKECDQKEDCPAWEFQSGHLCWFLCGTLCECTSESTYREKINVCRSCTIFQSLID